eukprot:8894384-Pyramimonas_sp.AAC.1
MWGPSGFSRTNGSTVGYELGETGDLKSTGRNVVAEEGAGVPSREGDGTGGWKSSLPLSNEGATLTT